MKYRKVIYPLVLSLFALQYCISVPVNSIPHSDSQGAGLSLGYGQGSYKLQYSTCSEVVQEEHRVTAYQMDAVFRPRRGLDYHVLYTQFRDYGRTVWPDTSNWTFFGIESFAAVAISPYVERTLTDHTRIFLQSHWMLTYTEIPLPNISRSTGEFGVLLSFGGGLSVGKNPEWVLSVGNVSFSTLSFYYRLPQNENWVLSAHAGLTLSMNPYVALGIALTPRAR